MPQEDLRVTYHCEQLQALTTNEQQRTGSRERTWNLSSARRRVPNHAPITLHRNRATLRLVFDHQRAGRGLHHPLVQQHQPDDAKSQHKFDHIHTAKPAPRESEWRPDGPLRLPPSGFTYFLTLSSKCFSTFPHGTCLLSVSSQYLALDGVYHPLSAAFPNNPTPGRRPSAPNTATAKGLTPAMG